MKVLKVYSVAMLLIFSQTIAAEKWTGYTYSTVSTTAGVKGMQRIAERIAAETNGRLEIKTHLGKTLLIATSDITQAVGDGVVDFAADYFFSGNVPIARVLNLPMLVENDKEWSLAFTAVKPILVKAFAQQNAIFLGSYRYPEQTIFTTFKMDSLADLAGRKIRVTSPEQGQFVTEFGGAPITLAGTDVPTSLERGLIDGVLTASAGGAKNWHEFLPYNYRFTVNYGNSIIIANDSAFAALKESDQLLLRQIIEEECRTTTAEFLIDEEKQKSAQKAAGMTIITAAKGDADVARHKLATFWETWAAENGPEYEHALTLVREALGK